jgi:hypothetical protein
MLWVAIDMIQHFGRSEKRIFGTDMAITATVLLPRSTKPSQ